MLRTPLLFPALFLSLSLWSSAAEKVKVVSFSTILTEIAERVGKEHAEVFGLVKPGIDPHEFEPKPADMKLVSQAQIILLSAKHMEGYVGKLKEATGTGGAVVEVGNKFPSLRLKVEGDEAKNAASDGTIEDPHWWHSVDNMKRATKVVLDELIKADPADKADFTANAAAYSKELDGVLNAAKSEIAILPRNKRKLVTSHDAFGYFAKEFGFTIYPIEGISPEDQPSSKKVSELIATIKKEAVKAIFLESIENPKVSTEITKETGAAIGGTLYADGLGEGEASTYAGMYKHNVTTIVAGLK